MKPESVLNCLWCSYTSSDNDSYIFKSRMSCFYQVYMHAGISSWHVGADMHLLVQENNSPWVVWRLTIYNVMVVFRIMNKSTLIFTVVSVSSHCKKCYINQNVASVTCWSYWNHTKHDVILYIQTEIFPAGNSVNIVKFTWLLIA